jgi:hypothetical protein
MKEPEMEIVVPDVTPSAIGKSMVYTVSRFALQVPKEVGDAEWDHLIGFVEFQRDCHQQGFDNLLTLIKQTRAHCDRQRALLQAAKIKPVKTEPADAE